MRRLRNMLCSVVSAGVFTGLGCGSSPTSSASADAPCERVVAALEPTLAEWYRLAWGEEITAEERARQERGICCTWDGLAGKGIDPAPELACFQRFAEASVSCAESDPHADDARLRACVDERQGCELSAAYVEVAKACRPPDGHPRVR